MKQDVRENDVTAAMAVVATVLLGYLVRHTLNPDGVAYLDLAAVLRRGDLHHFVQGYWSPLYPALLALIGLLSGNSSSSQIDGAHLLNVVAVILAIAVIWRWARAARTPWFGRAAITALVVCSAEPPRVEALTPDLILICIMACIGYELVVHRGAHWLRLGLLLGFAYLTKTGVWPWLIVAMALRTIMASSAIARRETWQSHTVTLALMLC
ncbi:MAG: glycosyltransferase family 39 protein, partial [Gemmatimonadota bacterium]